MGMSMSMGMSTDIVDLTSGDKKPSPQVKHDTIRPQSRPTPPVKNDVKPSPKQPPKPSPKLSQPPKVTPVPPPQIPQIPRFPPSQPSAVGAAATIQAQRGPPNPQPTRPTQAPPAAQAAPDSTIHAMPMAANIGGSDSTATGGGNSLNFTDMQFSLAPPSTKAQAAPPAPMPEFDLTTFAPQDTGSDMMSLDNSKPGNSNAGAAAGSQNTVSAPQQQAKEPEKTDPKLDDLFSLDNNDDGADSMFDLGSGVNDSTFDDMMYFGNNDSDMGQFDEQFFLPE